MKEKSSIDMNLAKSNYPIILTDIQSKISKAICHGINIYGEI